ncbi:MAG: hypothetical protein ACOX5F_06925 [Anaerovoracaceae bacterium]|jgi:hypothetical protein
MVSINNFDEQCITFSQMSMITNTRLFFKSFSIWIRIYILSRYFGIGTEAQAFERFYSETSGIGNLLQMAFDRQDVDEISLQLSRFTFAIRDLITAQLHGNIEAMDQNINRLYQIARNSASHLASINPYLNEEEWRNLLNTYIQYTIEETNALGAGDYSTYISYNELISNHTNKMGDVLAESLYNYIISGYTLTPQSDMQCITYEEMNQIFRLRIAWNEINTRTNMYMLSRYLGIVDAEAVKAFLNQFMLEYTDLVQQFFDTDIGSYPQELEEYVNLIDSLITAQIDGNVNEINRITQLLYENADQRAVSFASLNPLWNETEWRSRLYNRLRYTIDQSTAYLRGDYSSGLDILRTLLDISENAGDYLARSIFAYLT